ncbi:MFS transporter, partial [Escherichia coli]|uniref:MFS transporter n=1 Tax=Escherichia coli TaxID=562 RepID=UPI000AADCD59
MQQDEVNGRCHKRTNLDSEERQRGVITPFAVRPVGGIIFGSLGDRLGRKFVLLATVLLMGIASTLIGVLPTYETAGIWAPIMLIALRLLQGLGAGAEQAGAAVLMTEYAPDGKRGYYAALPFLGIQIGTFMASAV